ncbi:MAG: aspartate aminotransferase family protein [Candidatus Scalindua sp. AMX11]|nr:MAG: aspartate aminotransferase family protein [Candidatus Scalindua sp.]NOG83113.1 aspartate aminotransferase family protein [Planctomycetota bacterium]RZV75869.1 MAG: aspartate aminotransferase family protein [Candidatus Scalindua sp. SCAELEC01]TDE64928.1 MAG: aspartate aminotransferase family protein [Candidatus Scalindua sp. AMX11]GJQ60225.1 MAG: aminotransferase [Candidatus Scalindua sp.]
MNEKENNIGPGEIIRKKREFLIPCVYHFYQEPMQIVRGEGHYLFDHQGKRYLDFYGGVSVLNAGHCHPEITDKICQQVKTLQHTTTIYLTQPIVDLAEKVSQIAPGNLKKSFFCASGSEANEGALLLSQLSTKKHEFLALTHGLHGRTKLTMSVTGLKFWRTDSHPVGGISFVPNAYCYRCVFNRTYPDCDIECAKQIENVIETSTSGEVAALIIEPIQGNGGIITPPREYFTTMKEILDRYGILLIVDEIQTGFGRTGKMFAIEHMGVEPDIMTFAKSIANGTPVGGFITNDDIASSYTRPGASTFGGNPVTSVAALATLEVIEKYGLTQNAKTVGAYLTDSLQNLQEKHPILGDVRGRGLMVGAELVGSEKAPATQETDLILEYMKERGVLIGKTGAARNVLAFQPSLIINEDNIDELIDALDDALSHVEKQQK